MSYATFVSLKYTWPFLSHKAYKLLSTVDCAARMFTLMSRRNNVQPDKATAFCSKLSVRSVFIVQLCYTV